MSLTLPSAYTSASKQGNIKENWISQFFHQNSYLSFDGTDDQVDLGATSGSSTLSLTSSDDLTVAFWINFSTLGSTEWIFANNSQVSHYSGIFIYKDGDDKIAVGWGDGSDTGIGDRETMRGSTVLSADTWYFITITTDFSLTTTNTVIRVNNSGETVANTGSAGITDPVYASGNAYFGRRGNDYGEFKIRNFGIWAGELDSNNLTALYNSGNYLSFIADYGNYDQSSNLKGYWDFNDGGNALLDKTGNGTNGTLSGAVYGDFLPISFADTTVDSVFYPGVITDTPSIRSSIDLAKSTAKTGNITLNVVNFQYKGDDFSAELFLGTRRYINRNVKIYSQLNSNSALSNCLQVYQGRLIDISHDNAKIILKLTEQRPWDFISIPQDKATSSQVYAPVAYGDFTKNSANDFQSSKTFYPVPLVGSSQLKVFYAAQRSLDGNSGNEGDAHYYQAIPDQFTIMEDDGDETSSFDGLDCISVGDTFKRGTYYIRPTSVNSSNDYTDAANVIDTDTATYGEMSHSGVGSNNCMFDFPSIDGKLTEFTAHIKATVNLNESFGGDGTVKLRETSYAGSSTAFAADIINITSTATVSTSGAGAGSAYTSVNMLTAYTANDNTLPPDITLTFVSTGSGSFTTNCKIYDYYWVFTVENDNDNEPVASGSARSNVKQLYLGANGLTNSWDSSAINYGHEAHRDMLIRFAGYTTAAPENWSALNTDRTLATWKIRWWELEPVELKKVLEQLQYEFGFIFKFRPDGTGSIVYIRQASELSALLVQTLKQDDIANLKINNTPFSDLITKMEINYEKHPAESRYLSSVTSSNATARANWNIQAKENTSLVNLDMNIGTPATSGVTDGNAEFYSYYDNIFGDIKKIVTCDIVNPAVSYNLETGDIIQFSNTAGEMPVEPFGDNWADYYMIVELQRSPGKIKIQAREVG